MEEHIIFLPVNDDSKEVDYSCIETDIPDKVGVKKDEQSLIPGWSWKPFKVVPDFT